MSGGNTVAAQVQREALPTSSHKANLECSIVSPGAVTHVWYASCAMPAAPDLRLLRSCGRLLVADALDSVSPGLHADCQEASWWQNKRRRLRSSIESRPCFCFVHRELDGRQSSNLRVETQKARLQSSNARSGFTSWAWAYCAVWCTACKC